MTFRQWLTGRAYQPPYRTIYTTLTEIELQLEDDNATDRARLITMGYSASFIFAQLCRRTFIPFDAALSHDWTAEKHLRLEDDLLSLTSAVDNGGALTGGEYVLKPNNRYPYTGIQLLNGREWEHGANRESAITITGTWGYHPNPSVMWANTTTLSAAIASAGATTIAVTSAANFELLMYIKVGSEYMLITGISGTTLTVERGVNGSTATTHLISVVVYRYQQLADITRAVAHLALYLYQTRDQFGQSFATIEGNIEVAKNIPDYVLGVANHYKSGRKR